MAKDRKNGKSKTAPTVMMLRQVKPGLHAFSGGSNAGRAGVPECEAVAPYDAKRSSSSRRRKRGDSVRKPVIHPAANPKASEIMMVGNGASLARRERLPCRSHRGVTAKALGYKQGGVPLPAMQKLRRNQFERSGHCCSVVAQQRGRSRDMESFSKSKNCTPNPAG